MSGTNQEIISAGLSNINTDGWQQDDLVTALPNTPGQSIVFATSVASGGTAGSTPTNLNVADITGSNLKSRYGLQTLSITTGASSRSNMSNPTNTRFQIQSSTVIGFGADLAFNGGQIDPLTDDVYQIAGFANGGAIRPSQGIYIRPPYVGETNFYKYVLTYFDSGAGSAVNVVFETTVPYNSVDNNKFLSFFILIDATNDSATLTIKYDGNTYSQTISAILATYPQMWSGSIINSMIISVARLGTPAAGIARSIVVDKVYRYIKPNYN